MFSTIPFCKCLVCNQKIERSETETKEEFDQRITEFEFIHDHNGFIAYRGE